jgi:hypothetical protein
LKAKLDLSSPRKSLCHVDLDSLVGDSNGSPFVDCLDARADFSLPSTVHFLAGSGLVEIKQQSDQSDPLVPRQFEDSLGYLFDATCHRGSSDAFGHVCRHSSRPQEERV